MGITSDFPYETAGCTLEKDDCIFIYTDGVTEAIDAANTFYSDERLEKLLTGMSGAPARAVVSEVIANVRDFARGEAQADDIAAMAIRMT